MLVLFSVETDRLRLVWSGPEVPVRDARERVKVTSVRGAEARLERAGAEALSAPLRLDEETTFDVWLESRDGRPVEVRHADPVLLAGLSRARDGRVVYGSVRFGAQAGRSRFVLASAGAPEALVDVVVSPAKASWEEVAAMRARVETAASGAALASVRPAEADLGRGGGTQSPAAWIAALRDATPRLVGALGAIARDPMAVTARTAATVRPHAVRRAAPETLRVLRRASVWPERVAARPARPSLDTPAHRWLASGLDAALARARRLRDAERARLETPRRGVLVAELDRLIADLARARRIEPLVAAPGPPPEAPPPALLARPAYADAAEALALLLSTLRLATDGIGAPAQDLATLYETWAVLETVRSFADALGAAAPGRPFGARTVGADVRLGRGAAHGVVLKGTQGEAEIVRAPRFSGPPALLVQIPDLLVTLRLPGQPERRVVLDAKYRVGASGVAPPGDALGALHRYRDAIVDAAGRPLVRTAAVLFPAHAPPQFASSRLWTSLGTLGIGAVPLLPGDAGWLERLARAVVRGAAEPPS